MMDARFRNNEGAGHYPDMGSGERRAWYVVWVVVAFAVVLLLLIPAKAFARDLPPGSTLNAHGTVLCERSEDAISLAEALVDEEQFSLKLTTLVGTENAAGEPVCIPIPVPLLVTGKRTVKTVHDIHVVEVEDGGGRIAYGLSQVSVGLGVGI